MLYEAQQNDFISFDENQSNFPGRLSIKLYKIQHWIFDYGSCIGRAGAVWCQAALLPWQLHLD